jgi:RNA polymerase sigma-70 factor, ECF subfamily
MPETPLNAEQVAAVFLAARAAYPEIRLDDAIFLRHLERHLPDGADLGAICAGDLYLACACAEGVPAAVAALDRQYRARVPAYLAELRPTAAFVEDVAQAVLERLLVGAEGSPPRIAEYSGRGPLGSWLRVVTVRLALSLRRKRTEELAAEDEEAAPRPGEAPPVDPEADLLKQRHEAAFNAAFRAALGALTVRQRDLLRRHFLEGITLAELAVTFGVGRATVTRWIASARQEILANARRQLGEELNLRPAELSSLMGLMRSRLDLSLSSAFQS